jgi:hypothetical protein
MAAWPSRKWGAVVDNVVVAKPLPRRDAKDRLTCGAHAGYCTAFDAIAVSGRRADNTRHISRRLADPENLRAVLKTRFSNCGANLD